MTSKILRISLLTGAGFLLANASTLKAQTIYSDPFNTGTNNADLGGRTPDTTDATGATYVARTRGEGVPTSNTTVGNPAGSANTKGNGAAALSLASGGTFTRVANASVFSISGDLSVGTLTGSGAVANAGTSTRGIELGFYSSPFAQGTNDANEGFTGFALQNAGGSNGILQFVQNGVSSGHTALSVLTGTLSTTAFYNLNYSVDTSTGSLLSASFNGVDITTSFTTTAVGAFTDTATAFAGFGASSDTSGKTGNVDNFSVSVVPEPSSVALALIGGAGFVFLLRRRGLQSVA